MSCITAAHQDPHRTNQLFSILHSVFHGAAREDGHRCPVVCCSFRRHGHGLLILHCIKRLLPVCGAVQRDDVLRVLPEEQLQELPDVLHSGQILPHLLLPSAVNVATTIKNERPPACRCRPPYIRNGLVSN